MLALRIRKIVDERSSLRYRCQRLGSCLYGVFVRMKSMIYESRHEKICLRGLRSGKTQTGLHSYRDQLES